MTSETITKMAQSYLEVGGLRVNFQRTCRVPSGRMNSLPAGLGNFPVYRIADFKSGAPEDWHEDGYFFPMYKSEAMWMNFSRDYRNPIALIVAAGNINAISGKPFDPLEDKHHKRRRKQEKKGNFDIKLESPQNYLVVPPQPWLDGWKAEDGKVYQFVAAEMGSGETVEGQITGEEKIGGIQLVVYGPKEGLKLTPETRPHEHITGGSWGGLGDLEMCCFGETLKSVSKGIQPQYAMARASVQSMGLGRGGEISQKIYPDSYGLEVWNSSPMGLARFYLVSSKDFKQITGYDAPPTPITYQKYQELGMPWFDLYDEKYGDNKGSGVFGKLKPVSGGPSLVEKVSSSGSVEETKPEASVTKKLGREAFNLFK